MSIIEFPDIEWINAKFGYDLNPANLQSTLSFAILWNLMEKKIGETILNRDKLQEHIIKYSISKEIFNDEISFFRKRASDNYYYDDIESYIEDGLILEEGYKDLVRKFLNSESQDNDGEIIALFYIIRRLRNNLFHGMKEANNLESQEINFRHANSFIKKILDVSI